MKRFVNMRPMKRIAAVSVVVVLLFGAGFAFMLVFAQGHDHTLMLGYSDVETAKAEKEVVETLGFSSYQYAEPAPVIVTEDGDEISGQEATQVHTYQIHRDLLPVIERLDFPLDSAVMKRQALEAMEAKIPVHFFDHEETGCTSCQVLVLLDPNQEEGSEKLTVLSLNGEESGHSFQLQVEKMENGVGGSFYDGSLDQREGRLEEALTDEDLEALLKNPNVEVELLETILHTPEDSGDDGDEDEQNSTRDDEDPGDNGGGDNDNKEPGDGDDNGEEPGEPGDGNGNGEEPGETGDGNDNGEEPGEPGDGDDNGEGPGEPGDGDNNGQDPGEPSDGDGNDDNDRDEPSDDDSGDDDGGGSDDSEPRDSDVQSMVSMLTNGRITPLGGLAPAGRTLRPTTLELRMCGLSTDGGVGEDDGADSGESDGAKPKGEEAETGGSADDTQPEKDSETDDGSDTTENPRPKGDEGDTGSPAENADPGDGEEPTEGSEPEDPDNDGEEPPRDEEQDASDPPPEQPGNDRSGDPATTHKAIVLESSGEELGLVREEILDNLTFSTPGNGIMALDVGIQAAASELKVQNYDNLKEIEQLTWPNSYDDSPLTVVMEGNVAMYTTNDKRFLRFVLSRDITFESITSGLTKTIWPDEKLAAMIVMADPRSTVQKTLKFQDVVIDGQRYRTDGVEDKVGGGIIALSYELKETEGIIIEGAVIKNCDYTIGYHDTDFYSGNNAGRGYPSSLRDTYGLTGTMYQMNKDYGGGMFFAVNAAPGNENRNKLINCTFENNESESRGGGLCVFGYGAQGVDIIDCTFKDNKSEGNYAYYNYEDQYINGYGGALTVVSAELENLNPTKAKTVIKSTKDGGTQFINNTAREFGGHIYFTEYSTGLFEGNVTLRGGSAGTSGGGICSFHTSDITVAQGSSLIIEGDNNSGSGGGMTLYNNELNIVGDLVIRGNRASRQGGGCAFLGTKVNVTGTFLIDGNNANDGGGLWLAKRDVTRKNGVLVPVNTEPHFNGIGDHAQVTISNNTAIRNGGGIMSNSALGGYTHNKFMGEFKMDITNNTGAFGGGIHMEDTQIDVFEDVKLTVGGEEGKGNRATSQGGGICFVGAYLKIAGDVYEVWDGPDIPYDNYATVYIEGNTSGSAGGGIAVYDSTEHSNDIVALANNRNGGKLVIRNNTAATNRGGGIHINGNASLRLGNRFDVKIEDNTARWGGGISVGNNANLTTNLSGDKVTLTMRNNQAKAGGGVSDSGTGGGFHVRSGGNVVMDFNDTLLMGGSEAQANIAENDGGAIYIDDGGAKFVLPGNGSISHHTVPGNGGAIYVGEQSELNRVTFGDDYAVDVNFKIHNNTAAGSGGGVYYANGAKSRFSSGMYTGETDPNLTVSENTAGDYGGGIYLGGGNAIEVTRYGSNTQLGTRMAIENNKARQGGGIYAAGGDPSTITTSTQGSLYIRNNTKSTDGAGIYVADNATLRLDNAVTASGALYMQITGNEASGNGGGAYVDSTGRLYLERSSTPSGAFLVEKNVAEYGGGFYLAHSGSTDVRLRIIGNNNGTCTQLINNTARKDGGAIFVATHATARDPSAYTLASHADAFLAVRILSSGSTRTVEFSGNAAAHYDSWKRSNTTGNYLSRLASHLDTIGTAQTISSNPNGEDSDTMHNGADVNNYSNIPLLLDKVAEDGTPLAGAEFTAYHLTCNQDHDHGVPVQSSCWTAEVTDKVSGDDGYVDLSILAAGTWRIVETKIPEGYGEPDFQYEVKVVYNSATSRNTYTVEKLNPDSPGTRTTVAPDGESRYQWENALKKTTFPLFLRKVNGKNSSQGLGGAQFQLYRCGDETAGHTHSGHPGVTGTCWQSFGTPVSSGNNGLLEFKDLTPGTYALVETQAPNRYELPTGYWTFTMNENGQITDPEGEMLATAIIKLDNPDSDGVLYLVTNYEKTDLPLTGGQYLYFALGMMCVLTGWVISRGAKRKEW